MPAVSLSGRALLSVLGAEAQSFLQNIVTADVDALGADEVRSCALLSPQGKILFDFLVSRAGDAAFRLDCRAAVAADLLRRLILYRLRAKVEIAIEPEAAVFAAWDRAEPGALRDTRFPADANVRRIYAMMAADAGPAEWDALRVRFGVAESGTDYVLGDAFPHDVLLDQNGGVGFRKGCFVGQEVVSRMQHRGTARRRILVAQGATLLTAGSEVTAGGKAIGTLGTVAGRFALAMARTDRVADAIASGTPLQAGPVDVTLSIPPGMRFAFPSASADQAASD